jgi:hypothetical protein
MHSLHDLCLYIYSNNRNVYEKYLSDSGGGLRSCKLLKISPYIYICVCVCVCVCVCLCVCGGGA